MSDVTIKTVDAIPYFEGERSIPGIKFRMAGRDLDVTAWGMNVLEIDPGCAGYPEHDHAKDGQEEVYVVLRGGGTLRAGTDEILLSTGMLARIAPAQRRKIVPGPDGIVVLVVGGTPGKAYTPR